MASPRHYLTIYFAIIAAVARTPAAAQLEGGNKLTASLNAPATAVAGKSFDLLLTLDIEKGFHIQSDRAKDPYIPTKLAVTAPAGFKVGSASFPASKTLDFAGESILVFEGKVDVKIPIAPPAKVSGKRAFKLKVEYQACDDAVCFPPAESTASTTVSFSVPKASKPARPVKPVRKKRADVQTATYAQTSLFGGGDHLTATTQIPESAGSKPFDLIVKLKVKEGFHIQAADTKDPYIPTEVKVTAPAGYKVGAPVFPASTTATVAGETIPVYEGEAEVKVPITPPAGASGKPKFKVQVRYQACDENSCFPPSEVTADSAPTPPSKSPVGSGAANVPGFSVTKIEQFVPPDQFIQFLQTGTTTAGEDRLGSLLAGNLLLALPVIFLLGLALNLTPCVYPIIPITISYFGGQAESGGEPFTLSIFYVLGMALMYSLLGVAAGMTGNLFGSQLQNPWVLATFAVIMFAMALSQFDRKDGTPIWEFQLPAGLRNKAQRKSGVLGAALMGLMVGVVAAPCIGPAVIALLQFVGTQKSPALGFIVFFTLALGLGLPYVFLATISGSVKKIPRSGEWMIGVKHIFGAIMGWMGFYYLQNILNGWYPNLGTYALVAVAGFSGVFLLFFDNAGRNARAFDAFRKVVGVAAIAFAVVLARPAPPETIRWQPYSDAALAQARSEGKKVLVDFTADWCAQCQELEHKTFSDPTVGQTAGDYVALRADMTDYHGEQGKKWQTEYGIKGLPTVARLIPTGESVAAR